MKLVNKAYMILCIAHLLDVHSTLAFLLFNPWAVETNGLVKEILKVAGITGFLGFKIVLLVVAGILPRFLTTPYSNLCAALYVAGTLPVWGVVVGNYKLAAGL